MHAILNEQTTGGTAGSEYNEDEAGMPDGERHQRVLCVDDNEAELYAVAKTLRDAGFDVCTAGSYFDALELLERPEQTIDVLLTDVVLNLGNGFALARIARRHRPDLKTVYVTAFDIPTVEAVGPVLRKPVSEPDIVETIRTVTAGESAGKR